MRELGNLAAYQRDLQEAHRRGQADALGRLKQWAVEHDEYETQEQIGILARELGVTL